MDNLKNNCPAGHGQMSNAIVTKNIEFRGKQVSCQIESLQCPKCGLTRSTLEQTADAQLAIAESYRQQVGLLTGEEIKSYRENLGLSQQQLADRAQCSKMSIVRWEMA